MSVYVWTNIGLIICSLTAHNFRACACYEPRFEEALSRLRRLKCFPPVRESNLRLPITGQACYSYTNEAPYCSALPPVGPRMFRLLPRILPAVPCYELRFEGGLSCLSKIKCFFPRVGIEPASHLPNTGQACILLQSTRVLDEKLQRNASMSTNPKIVRCALYDLASLWGKIFSIWATNWKKKN